MVKRDKKNIFIFVISILCLGTFFAALFLFQYGGPLFTETQQRYYLWRNQHSSHPATSTIETFTLSSSALNDAEKELSVYVPLQYQLNKKKHFPVLYLLHGDPGNNQDWIVNTDIQQTLDELITNKEMPPMLVVFPDGNGTVTQDSQYVNATKVDQNMEDYVVSDVVKMIDGRYRTIANRKGRALGGSSSGGYAALNLGLHHNDEFSVLVSFSGYFMNQEWVTRRLFGKDQNIVRQNNPLEYISHANLDPQTFVYLVIGSNDYARFVKDNHAMDDALFGLKIPHILAVEDGQHG